MKLVTVKDIIDFQMSHLSNNIGMQRDLITSVQQPIEGFATVISGIRRCGKSTLMAQIIDKTDDTCLYLNFDTPRLHEFTLEDFELVDAIAVEMGAKRLFFDEIQLVSGWESYIRSALDAGYQVTVTGSNATMLSQELGTRLTGRHITKELFPFSFYEYCRFRSQLPSSSSLDNYLKDGGFPQYLKQGDELVLQSLLNDIVYRDVAVRHGIKDVTAMQSLLIYLITNIGNLATANKLASVIQVKTAKTVLEYFSYFMQTYIVSFVPRFSYSFRTQIVSPKKVYCIDNGLHMSITTSASTDTGRRLENMVYGELHRKNNQLYYYNENNSECDFIVCQKNIPTIAYQVCYELNRENETREINGLLQAMQQLHIDKGYILTANQSDIIIKDGQRIEVLPAWKAFALTHHVK